MQVETLQRQFFDHASQLEVLLERQFVEVRDKLVKHNALRRVARFF